MLKKTFMLGLLVATACVSFSTAARADQQENIQKATNNAASVGDLNSIGQDINQANIQRQSGGYFPGAGAQVSGQDAMNSAAAVGNANNILQSVGQFNHQHQR